jgi:maltose alpha-D-glucosyltransferase/alpha-amylase
LNEVLCDALGLPEFAADVMKSLEHQAPLSLDQRAKIVCHRWNGYQPPESHTDDEFEVTVPSTTELLSTFLWDRGTVLRKFRRADEGLSPDVEIFQYLQDAGFTGIAPIIGTIEYRRPENEPAVMAALHQYKAHQSDAWQLMVDLAGRFLEVVAARTVAADSHIDATHVAIDVSSENWQTLIEPFLKTGQSIATFTAHLHLTLGAAPITSALSPATTQLRPFYQSLRNAAGELNSMLATLDPSLPDSIHELATQVRAQYLKLLNYLHKALDLDVAGGKRIRCHGRYHLGRLLVSGQEFLLTDFEGLKDRPLSERRIKRSPLHDVASMLNSFRYAVDAVRLELLDRTEFKLGFVREEDHARLTTYSTAWLDQLEDSFFQVYCSALEPAGLLPLSIDGCRKLLRLYQLEQSIHEVEHDLARRPNWAQIPLAAILRIIQRTEASDAKT